MASEKKSIMWGGTTNVGIVHSSNIFQITIDKHAFDHQITFLVYLKPLGLWY